MKDSARVSAAIPKGVSFLAAAFIWKGVLGKKGTSSERQEVHGLTTAAGVWLSAAIGVGTGGRLIIVSAYAVALVIIVLRLGPRLYFSPDNSSLLSEMEEEDWEDEDEISAHEAVRLLTQGNEKAESDSSLQTFSSTSLLQDYDKISREEPLNDKRKSEVQLKPRDKKTRSLDPRALMRARTRTRSRPTFYG